MISNFEIDQGTYRMIYNHLKPYLIPFVVIAVCIIVFFNVIIPQIQTFFESRQKEDELRQQNTALKENITFLQNLNEEELTPQYEITTEVLPLDKDFVGILNSIGSSVGLSGVTLDDFSFTVGELATRSAEISAQPSIKMQLSLAGSISATKSFIDAITQRFPLSEVSDLTIAQNASSVTVKFFYKPFSQTEFDPTQPIQPVSKKYLELIAKLNDWKAKSTQAPLGSGSSSAALEITPKATPSGSKAFPTSPVSTTSARF